MMAGCGGTTYEVGELNLAGWDICALETGLGTWRVSFAECVIGSMAF
jgi:hypothetical protein